jgi:hypothetical protein
MSGSADAGGQASTATDGQDSSIADGKSRGTSRAALIGVLVVLAIRGLRPRRYRTL